jgi:hypothetical protein
MFFKREKPHVWTFEERLTRLQEIGFEVRPESPGKARISRNGFAAVIEHTEGGNVRMGKAGVVAGNEIGVLVHGGYQLFFRTPSGRELPALASQLKSLHAFDEDLREGLGLTSLYNVSLGTTCEDHLYDRVADRDAAQQPRRPWETKTAAR